MPIIMARLAGILSLLGLVCFSGCQKAALQAKRDYDDARLAAVVKARLIETDPLSTLRVNVYVDSGVVKLSGEVKDAKMSRHLGRVAGEIPGVSRVDNQIRINPNLVTPEDIKQDLVLEQKVRAALLLNLGAGAMELRVQSRLGRVNLEGTLGDAKSVAAATRAAMGIEGVRSVENRITVEKKTRPTTNSN